LVSRNKILLFLGAGAGDLINTTGVIIKLKQNYPNLIIDFLCPAKQSYILKGNWAVTNILHFEDYNIAPHVMDKKYAVGIEEALPGYEQYINIWKSEHADYIIGKIQILQKHGYSFTYKRDEVGGSLFPDTSDFFSVKEFLAKNNIARGRVCLIEDDSITGRVYKQPIILKQLGLQPKIAEKLAQRNYTVISNNLPHTISCSSLNLIQIKMMFEMVGSLFLGLSSGMTTAFFTYPNRYEDKYFMISGMPSWNYMPYIKGMSGIFLKNYTWEAVDGYLRRANRSTPSR